MTSDGVCSKFEHRFGEPCPIFEHVFGICDRKSDTAGGVFRKDVYYFRTQTRVGGVCEIRSPCPGGNGDFLGLFSKIWNGIQPSLGGSSKNRDSIFEHGSVMCDRKPDTLPGLR